MTPQFRAHSADVTSSRLEAYARACVTAYWRLLVHDEHRSLYKDAVARGLVFSVDELRLSGTQIRAPESDRFLGSVDLVRAFDERRQSSDGGGERVPLADLVNLSEILKAECDDVVILRQTHRLDDGHDDVSDAERHAYRAECDRFLFVLRGMANCTWSREDHAWLSQRNRSVLMRTPEGREELKGDSVKYITMYATKAPTYGVQASR